ncbi:MAG: YidC/Oxa1 family membrane protein insertase [Candidatus Moranbacteria bacterium]|nr:YidC/Oxa1 family membrane protein insertase [Candidatus Moranbacteria bacterium]MDD3964618.1 YidC/Oxa1 family membrane protein insertase [Candidatus Moranbacteria bacterium]
MMHIFDISIYQPLYNTLIFFYNVIPGHDFGIAIILTTLALKSFLIPLSKKQIESQRKMQELQPKIKAIQQKYKNNKEQQTKALMAFYKENNANPFSGCLPLIIQLVFLIAIYRVIINISQSGFVVNPTDLYRFIQNPGEINHLSLHILDLTKPSYILAILSALAQYFQTKMLLQSPLLPPKEESSSSEPDFASIMNKQMLYLGPGMTFFIGVTFPAALSLYWLFSTLFMLFQQKVLLKVKEEK